MILARTGSVGPVRWAVVSAALEGETESGDLHVVVPTDDGVLVAVIDGLGHGHEAAAAALDAARALESAPSRSPVEAMLACHRALARGRGAVLSLARIHPDALTWVGVGNVEAVLVRGPHSPWPRGRLLLAGGVVGHSLPTLRPSGAPIARGDMLVLGTDGLSSDFTDHVDLALSPERVVECLMSRCRTGRDDALVLAARFDGASA